MRVYELFESRSADLFHGTNMPALIKMLHDNTLVARAPIHNELIPREFKGHRRTVSLTRDSGMATNFARSKAGGEEGINSIPVIIILDQDKLYRALGRRMRPYNDLESLDGVASRGQVGSESEEVVFGNITNINSYIKKIVVHMPTNYLKERYKDLDKCKIVFDNPKTIVLDFLNKNLTGRQFMDLINGYNL